MSMRLSRFGNIFLTGALLRVPGPLIGHRVVKKGKQTAEITPREK